MKVMALCPTELKSHHMGLNNKLAIIVLESEDKGYRTLK